MYQYVYRMQTDKKSISDYTDANIHIINGIGSLCVHSSFLKKYFTFFEYLKIVVKTISKKRVLIIYAYEGSIAAYCWLNFGFCKHYKIEKTAVVIGPVMTDSNFRGKGFATCLLKTSINYINKLKMVDAVYIDTSEDNFPMQAVIKKCGFGDPVSRFERSEGGFH